MPVPAGPSDLTAEWLTGTLREARAIDRAAVRRVEAEVIGEERGFTGVICRLRPEYDRDDPAAPASLIAKLPEAVRPTDSSHRERERDDPAIAREHRERGAREVWFYRHLAGETGVAIPRMIHAAVDPESGRSVLLLEDLAGHRPGDALAGGSVADAGLVLEQAARLHATWWESPRLASLDPIPRWGADRARRRDLYARRLEPFLAWYGERLPSAIRDLAERLRSGYGPVLDELDAAPATLIHGDLHLDNVLFDDRPGSTGAVLLDWQSVLRGAAALDVACFLSGALAIDDRRAAGEGLLRRYLAALHARGVPAAYGLESLRRHFRLGLIWMLAGTVGWLGAVEPVRLGGRERALVEATLEPGRLFAALLDEGVAELVRPS